MSYSPENIPDIDKLLRRVHKSQVGNGKPFTGTFTNLGLGMSTDWNKYSTPIETRKRILKDQNILDYGVVELNVGKVREIEEQKVQHTPTKENRAHSDVIGKKTARIKKELKRIANWVIKPEN